MWRVANLTASKRELSWVSWASSSNTVDPEASELLEYLPEHKVLICKQCGYAVQPSSLPRHLKDIHRITRSRRNQFLQFASRFPAIGDANDVHTPSTEQFPVPFLPVETGWACNSPGCDYLCVTDKRMKLHWSAQHQRQGEPGIVYMIAPLQTFFRGSQLRYFTDRSTSGHRSSIALPTANSQNNEICGTTHLPQSHDDSVDHLTTAEIFADYCRLNASAPSLGVTSMLESDLLTHFTQSTAPSLFEGEILENIWQQTVPKLALEFPFLLHGLCACAAFHLAYRNPADESRFMLQGLKYQNQAVSQFSRAIENVTSSNSEAIFAFAHLLVVCTFASERGGSRSHYFADRTSERQLPAWLYMLRGACTMLREYPEFREGSMKWLIELWVRLTLQSGALEKALLAKFMQVVPSPGSRWTWSAAEVEVYKDTASKLAVAFESIMARETPTNWEIFHVWPLKFSDDFMILVDQNHPGALILLGHYCVLLKRLDSLWFMQGSAARLFRYVRSHLDGGWKDYLNDAAREFGD